MKKLLVALTLLVASQVLAATQKKIILTGQIVQSDATLSSGTPVVFTVPFTQNFPNGFILEKSTRRFFTDVLGNLPLDPPKGPIEAIQGGVYVITIGDGEPIEVTMPPVDTLPLSSILGEVQVPPPKDLVDKIAIGPVCPAADFRLTVENPIQFGTATLFPKEVCHFTLTSDSSANGNKITALAAATVAGDAISQEQSGAKLTSLQVTDVLRVGPQPDTTANDQAGRLRNARYTFGQLPTTAVDGNQIWCSDCQVSAQCTPGGTGALAVRVNGIWSCGLVTDGLYAGSVTVNDGYKIQGLMSYASMKFRVIEEEVTCNSGTVLCTSSLTVPDAALVIGIMVQVSDDLVGCTAFDVGDGFISNRWADTVGPTQGTATTMADFRPTQSSPMFTTAAEPTYATCTSGIFSGGKITFVSFIIDSGAAFVPTFTMTPSAPTPTGSPTETFTIGPSPTRTATTTPSNTLAPGVATFTPTRTPTPTNTGTSTPTNSPVTPGAPTFTPTLTPTAAGGIDQIEGQQPQY